MSPRPLLDPSPSPSPPPSLPPPPPPVPPSSPTLSIEDQVARLRRPSDDDEWVKCFVQPKDFESIKTSWAKIHHLPQFHVVGKLKDGYMVAVAAFVLPLLNDLEIPYSHADGEFSSDWRPHRDMSSNRRWFVQNAIAGISMRARGLVDLYRGMFNYWSTVPSDLRLPIEWAILLRDIENAPPAVLETFYSSSLLLDSLLHDATYLRQTLMDVIERLRRANTEMAMVPPSSEEIPIHIHHISLLRGLLEHAGGQRDVHQYEIDKHTITRLLGQGASGIVVEAKRKKRVVAIKVFTKGDKAARVELKILQTLRENDGEKQGKCIRLLDYFRHDGVACIVVARYPKSLFQFLRENGGLPFPMSHIQSFARQLLTATSFLQTLTMIHTDIKPDNILLCDDAYQTFVYKRQYQRHILHGTEILLADFGSSVVQIADTRCVLAELFKGTVLFQRSDDAKGDWEHLAMIQDFTDCRIAVLRKPSKSPFSRGIKRIEDMIPKKHTGFFDLLRRMLIYEPEQRIAAKDALDHEWLRAALPPDDGAHLQCALYLLEFHRQ
ncbi:hypothetical protein SPBR_09193 [Sporothrix brasiliensis 5110]|uniref:Protein kinase domain-containing protein n=1 Tax=Sporothrix brasiliensis 5110 TaxID=1398154 RepID=A0A0C2F5S2_9PEZI|nr:uncharacterized protein SPBR_09193 [Sporothrix brasiliensis 5110]KIH94249.1 hypothetical protein SPBR_09193 [Sporothrix brasiliensis 5110]